MGVMKVNIVYDVKQTLASTTNFLKENINSD